MRETFTQLYIHLVWATWDRLPLLSGDFRQRVYASIRAECVRLKVEVVAIGGVEDHVHLLVRLPATVAVADLMKQVKGATSHLVTHRLADIATFKWQGAYGAFSVSRTDVPAVRDYILRQEEHHRDRSIDPSLEPE